MKFTAKILNLTVIKKNITRKNLTFFSPGFIKRWNLDIYSNLVFNESYSQYFLIPANVESKNFVAFVPIIYTLQKNIFKVYSSAMIIFVFVSASLYKFNNIRASMEQFKLFDFLRLALGQSVAHEPQKIVYRIIMLTIILATAKIMNDYLLDLMSYMLENREMQFETYEDLYNSNLQTYTDVRILKENLNYFNNNKEHFLLKILNRTLINNNTNDCFNTLIKWKNVSCLVHPPNTEMFISTYKNPDGSRAMKAAEPSIFSIPISFHLFADASPYAMKFFEVMHKINEGSLMHWPALFDESTAMVYPEKTKVIINYEIKLEQLLTILSIGFSISIIVFIFEWIKFSFGKVKISRYCSTRYVELHNTLTIFIKITNFKM